MKNIQLISLFTLSALVLGGCANNSLPVNTLSGTDIQENQTGIIETGATAYAKTSQDYLVNLSDSEPSLSLMLNSGDTIHLMIQQPATDTLVRVSQIISPDGSMDGPFSSDTTYTASQSGIHKFIIRANMMASNEVYTGSVTVSVSISK